MKRRKQAISRGYQAFIDGLSIEDNYFKRLGARYLFLSGFWEAGFLKAKENSTKSLS